MDAEIRMPQKSHPLTPCHTLSHTPCHTLSHPLTHPVTPSHTPCHTRSHPVTPSHTPIPSHTHPVTPCHTPCHTRTAAPDACPALGSGAGRHQMPLERPAPWQAGGLEGKPPAARPLSWGGGDHPPAAPELGTLCSEDRFCKNKLGKRESAMGTGVETRRDTQGLQLAPCGPGEGGAVPRLCVCLPRSLSERGGDRDPCPPPVSPPGPS